MHRQPHPDPETLDRLRAGLLDHRPNEKAALQAHLAVCDSCRTQHDLWPQLAASSMPGQLDTARIGRDLQHARAVALAGRPGAHRLAGLVPYATAALLLIAVSFGIWNHETVTTGGQPETASVAQSVPDIYEDLDFYLWLANQDKSGSEDSDGNPNNT